MTPKTAATLDQIIARHRTMGIVMESEANRAALHREWTEVLPEVERLRAPYWTGERILMAYIATMLLIVAAGAVSQLF